MKSPRSLFTDFARPKARLAGEPEEWEKYLRRNVNFFYQCAAVESVRIGRKGVYFYEWQINLYKGNSPAWLKPHLENLVKRISIARTAEGFQPLQGITIKSPNEPETSHFVPHTSEYENANLLERIANGTSCRFRYQERIVQGKILKGNLVIARLGTFASFSAASQAVAGKPRNGWKDWELQFPETSEWVKAAVWRRTATT